MKTREKITMAAGYVLLALGASVPIRIVLTGEKPQEAVGFAAFVLVVLGGALVFASTPVD
jgi:hypothetical protein